MKNFKRFFVSLFICAVFFSVGFGVYEIYFKNRKIPDQFIQDKAAIIRLIESSSEIHRVWIEGEDSKEWNLMRAQCLKEYSLSQQFDESLLRCHPILLECFEKFYMKKNFNLQPFSEFNELHYRYMTKSNNSYRNLREVGALVTIQDNESKKTMNVFLEDTCHETYLEQRAFAYGEQVEIKDGIDYRFDNFDRHFYLDTHLVTNSDINTWIKFGNSDFTKGLKEKSGDDLFLPATDLLFNQMENYCSFKGKQVLQAHLFDAATFLPMDLEEKIPKKNNRSPYYWTKKASEYKSDCKLIYSKECLNKYGYRLNSIEPTWSGLNDSMGGVLEAFRNPIDPDSNLKASSFYFDSKSSWHKLGFRAGWDGDGFHLRNFDFRGLNPYVTLETFQVGFRCMREVMP